MRLCVGSVIQTHDPRRVKKAVQPVLPHRHQRLRREDLRHGVQILRPIGAPPAPPGEVSHEIEVGVAAEELASRPGELGASFVDIQQNDRELIEAIAVKAVLSR